MTPLFQGGFFSILLSAFIISEFHLIPQSYKLHPYQLPHLFPSPQHLHLAETCRCFLCLPGICINNTHAVLLIFPCKSALPIPDSLFFSHTSIKRNLLWNLMAYHDKVTNKWFWVSVRALFYLHRDSTWWKMTTKTNVFTPQKLKNFLSGCVTTHSTVTFHLLHSDLAFPILVSTKSMFGYLPEVFAWQIFSSLLQVKRLQHDFLCTIRMEKIMTWFLHLITIAPGWNQVHFIERL